MGRQWCKRTETILVEEEVTPRQEDLVPCTSLHHYQRRGWRLDLTWSGRARLCPIYKPPETRPAAWNQTVPPAEYHEACPFAYCAAAPAGSGREERLEAARPTLASYAQDCARGASTCAGGSPASARLCLGGRLCSDCASACPPSCSAVGEGGEGSCGEECVSGCECPPGLFWDGAPCVPSARWPCYHRRRRYDPGDTVRRLRSPRVGQDGRWLCAQAPCPAEGAVGGDGHYLTFDGRSFSFRGRAGRRFSLVQDFVKRQLLTVLEHGDCNAGSCLHAISVSLGDTHVQLRDSGAVLVDGQDVVLPWSGTGGLASPAPLPLSCCCAGLGPASSRECLTLRPTSPWTPAMPSSCAGGRVSGWTKPQRAWNQQDDFLTPAGDVETSIAAFASKFQVAGEGRCPSEDSAPLSRCSTHTQRHIFAEAACAILHGPVFQECHGLVGREPFHPRCLAAACGCTPGGDCLCPMLAAYARRCAQEGALLSWRDQTLCPVLCPGGQEYQECAPVCGRNCGETEGCGELGSCLGAHRYAPGSATMKDCNRCICQERGLWNCTAQRCISPWAFCPRGLVYVPGACLLTCDSPSANGSCPPGSMGGCVCPPGTVLLDEGCIPPELCPCCHGGQWYPPNAAIQEDYNIWVCQGRQWRCTGQRCDGQCQASGPALRGQRPHLHQALTVRLQSTVVHMLRGQAVAVNGVSVMPPKVYTGSGLSLRRAGLFLLLTTCLGLTLLWDGGTRVLVQLSPEFRGRLAGLCGDFDGDASNDLRNQPGDLPPPCAVNAHRAGWARARCGVMLQPLFARCHAEVPPEQHCEWCMHDTRGCDSGGDCECLCSAIATYADECSRPGTHMRWRSQELCQALPSVISGVCLEPAPCPCEWRGSFFPPGTVLQRDCGNCTCQESQWLCGDDGSRGQGPVPGGAEGEAPCQESGHCVPHGWLCDYQDDRGDGSDEEGCATPGRGEGQMSCSSGHCLPLALICDGQDDCGDGTDEQGCPCPQDSLACADGRCLPPALLCDGHPDFPDAADEESCQGQVNCTPGEVSCVDGACVGTIHLCDGICDCPDGADEGPGHCPLPSLPTPPAGTLPGPSAVSRETAPTPQASVSPPPPCGPVDFASGGSGEGGPRGWRCDGEEDCADGGDESGCDRPCAPHLPPCARGPLRRCATARTGTPAPAAWRSPLCPRKSDLHGLATWWRLGAVHRPHLLPCGLPLLDPSQRLLPPCGSLFPCGLAPQLCLNPERLCDGLPDCPQGEDELGCGRHTVRLMEAKAGGAWEVCDGQPDCELVGEAGPSREEQRCEAWGPWSPWAPCSQTRGPGVRGCSRRCSPPSLPVLRHCPGPEYQTQACFTAACPTMQGHQDPAAAAPPTPEGGQTCAMLPGDAPSTRQTRPCPQDGCPSVTCSGELVFHPCAPCPLTCDDVSGQAECPPDRPCSSPGCWRPTGQVLGDEGRCVWPRQCPCLVDGTHYWRIEADCRLCICQDGRPQRCRPNPDCAVNCGWSSWSPWAECLGPCESRSIQWSFQSANNARLAGRGRQRQGIHRKARSYCTRQGPAGTLTSPPAPTWEATCAQGASTGTTDPR
ncbi:hypothetical protein J1605_009422 [Eschrichtius robustus]|uniref:VWFD domain-containing protein n=1 Tax=Eschrichtius robustus TaxID=9764 RepID=A0AB34GTN8_ESCRO|nr:hypothetical protein J1605_009422 [Eschrichtius robustus]